MLSIAFPTEVFHKRVCVAGSRARTPDPELVAKKGSQLVEVFPIVLFSFQLLLLLTVASYHCKHL